MKAAVLTAVLTTIIGFLPVFLLLGAEGKLFRPLAFTKTFALTASVVIALSIVPAAAHMLFGWQVRGKWLSPVLYAATVAVGLPADLLRRRPDIRQAEFVAATREADRRLEEQTKEEETA